MKKGIFRVLFICGILSISNVYSQKETIYLSSDEYINEGIEFHNKGEYDKAINNYQKVSKCDPNYKLACYEIALSYYYQDKYEEALVKCKEAILLKYDESFLYSLIGSILDEMGKQEEGIALLTDALKKWPYNQNILYNLAVCFISNHQPDQAEKILLRSVLINPYHSRTHLALAKVNYMMGRIAQSYLAYSLLITINPTINNISSFEEAISQKPKLVNQEYKYPYSKNVDSKKWDEIKDLLQSELAFSDNFDYNYDVSYSITRQSLMLFQKLTFDPSDTSIYSRLYARFFVELYKKFSFEIYINYILKNTSNEKVVKWNEKNADKIKGFVDWAQTFLNKGRLYGFLYQDEKELKQTYHFDDNGDLTAIGEMDLKNSEVKNGSWLIIGKKGYISEKGIYKNDKTEGKWLVFWPNGNLRKQLAFMNDKLEGTSRIFYPNETLETIINYKSGERHGLFEKYSSSGLLTQKNNYVDGLTHGPGVFNNYDDGFSRSYTYVNDTIEKEVKEVWLNGTQKLLGNYNRGIAEGFYATWYSNSGKELECNYRRDTLAGKYYKYYPNNQISTEHEYDKTGKLSGKIISYNRNGNITSEENEYKEGKLTGTRTDFFIDGKRHSIQTYNNDVLVKVECFDNKGNQIYSDNNSDSSIYFKSFYEDGIVASEGLLINDERDSIWKFYNPLGILTSEWLYSKGKLEGVQHDFYANGQVQKEYFSSSNYILGEYKEYYINGHLKLHGNYDSSGFTGKWINYFKNDSISNISFYKDGDHVGSSCTFHPEGLLESEEFYNDEGKSIRSISYGPDGSVLSDIDYEYGSHTFDVYFPNGKLKERKNISDNEFHGLYEEFYPNGNLAAKIEYNHKFINGYYKKWDHNGNISYEMPYIMNLAEGEGKWYVNGKLDYVGYYELGKNQGKAISYHYNGQKARETEYVDDERIGYTNYYSPEGILMYRVRYENNIMKAYSYLDKTGNMVPETVIMDSTTKIIAYYPNGKISAVIELYRGLYHGKLVNYYPTGGLLREATFKLDDIEGIDKKYYPNNRLRELTSYSFDNRHGLYELYFENGQKQKTGKFFMNEQEGDWKIFNSDNSLKETLIYRNAVIYDIK